MKISKMNLRVLLLFLTGLFYSCSPAVKVTTDYDHNTNFKEFKTFAVYDLKAKEGQLNQLNADRVLNAIRAELIAKGFTETSDNPDLKVNAVLILKDKKEMTAMTNYYGFGGFYRPYRWGGGMMGGTATTSFNTYDYVDKSLVIDIVSTKTNKLVWQGIGSTELETKPDKSEQIGVTINKIMAGFPPDLLKK